MFGEVIMDSIAAGVHPCLFPEAHEEGVTDPTCNRSSAPAVFHAMSPFLWDLSFMKGVFLPV